ncbi:MAG: hypothetical protein JWM20_257 [Patescibacteria group bacterium]|nr:hypothetical protein [Patescibacteria group bacterium]
MKHVTNWIMENKEENIALLRIDKETADAIQSTTCVVRFYRERIKNCHSGAFERWREFFDLDIHDDAIEILIDSGTELPEEWHRDLQWGHRFIRDVKKVILGEKFF